MLRTAMGGLVPTTIIDPVSAANTAAATSAWVEVPVSWKGDVQFQLHTGAITGSLAAIVQTADDNSGTNARTVTFSDATAAFTNVSAANKIESKVVERKALGTHVKFVGTVTTGPVVIGVSMQGAVG